MDKSSPSTTHPPVCDFQSLFTIIFREFVLKLSSQINRTFVFYFAAKTYKRYLILQPALPAKPAKPNVNAPLQQPNHYSLAPVANARDSTITATS